MSDKIIIVPYNPEWPDLFRELGRSIRDALGDVAVRIDHIGSTAIPGLAAKPIIDIQISVRSFEPLDAFKEPLHRIGFQYIPDNPDLTKRYFREMPGSRRTHIHVRREGSWSEQFMLLFRDYLRCHPDDCREYANLKYDLAEKYRENRQGYVDAKGPFIWKMMQKANEWSQRTGWMPGESDA